MIRGYNGKLIKVSDLCYSRSIYSDEDHSRTLNTRYFFLTYQFVLICAECYLNNGGGIIIYLALILNKVGTEVVKFGKYSRGVFNL